MQNGTYKNYQKRIRKVLTFIEEHLDEDVSLERLASVAYFSQYHFHRLFSGLVGESVKSYVRRLKLERAAHQLIFTKISITEIAFNAGFNSLEAFSRAFQENFKLSPSKYRQSIREHRFEHLVLPELGEIRMQVEIKNVAKMRVACVRHIGPYMACETAWQKLFSKVSVAQKIKF